MESVILLNSNENTRQVEEEEKNRFVQHILQTIGLPLDDIWDNEGNLSLEGKIKLRNLLNVYGVQLIGTSDGELQIFAEGEMIAEWKKPTYILKRDLSQIDPKKKLYLQMHVNYYSIFEGQE